MERSNTFRSPLNFTVRYWPVLAHAHCELCQGHSYPFCKHKDGDRNYVTGTVDPAVSEYDLFNLPIE